MQGAVSLTLYPWNTRTAEHWFCKTCGCASHQRPSNPNDYRVKAAIVDGITARNRGAIPWSDRVNQPSARSG